MIVVVSVNLTLVPFTAADAQSRSRSSKPAPENSIPSKGQVDGAIVGIIAGLVVGTIVVVYLLTRKQTITGCVTSNGNGMTITDEKDKRIYTLEGGAAGVTPGDRVKLQGKKIKPQAPDTTYRWQTEKVNQDFGACHP